METLEYLTLGGKLLEKKKIQTGWIKVLKFSAGAY